MNEQAERRLRIAYVIPGTDVSGGLAVICQHTNRLRDRGHEVFIVTETSGRSMDWFPHQAVPVIGVEDYPSGVDILVATGWTTSFRVAALPAGSKFYFVQSDETRFHPVGSPWRHMTRISYMLDLNYLTEARWIRQWLEDSFDKVAELVPNGLDETIFFPSEPLEARGERPRVLIEGAIDLPYKGMAEAHAAIAGEDVEIWCVSALGRPPKHWRCDRFFGQVPMSEMRFIYSSCDILLKLSRVEGFYGPPMEMMACGGAVVTGRVTGHDEYIRDGVNALVVDIDHPNEATAAVRRLIDDPSLRASLVEAGLETAREWRWGPSIDVLERLYLDVAEGRRGTPWSPPASGRSFSLAYVYGLLRGEVLRDPGQSPDGSTDAGRLPDPEAVRIAASFVPHAVDALTSDPAERLIARLRQKRWFRVFATGLFRAYRAAKAIRGAVRGVTCR